MATAPQIAPCISAAGCVNPRGAGGAARAWTSFDGRLEDLSFKWGDLFESPFPRFGRMDPLCRAALAAVEMMGAGFAAMAPERRARVGIALATTTGCVEADAEYWKGAGCGQPSPALFIYTLPSTPIGEIAIRHKLTGPNVCLPCAPGGAADALREAAAWVASGEADAAIAVYANALGPAAGAFAGAIPELAAAPIGAWAMFVEGADSAASGGLVPCGDFDFISECEARCGSGG